MSAIDAPLPVRVVIVARTHARNAACIGGLAVDTLRNVRLMEPGGSDPSHDAGYALGDLWDLEYQVPADLVPPHIEDVVVLRSRRVGHVEAMRSFLLERIAPWEGAPDVLFDGLLNTTQIGSGFISMGGGLPNGSVGFWIPDRDLVRVAEERAIYYRYPRSEGVRYLRYSGFMPPPPALPAGTLCRVSLARWWRPEGAPDLEARCYLQLSGWFQNPTGAP